MSDSDSDIDEVERQRILQAQAAAESASSTEEDSDVAQMRLASEGGKVRTLKKRSSQRGRSSGDSDDDSDSDSDDDSDSEDDEDDDEEDPAVLRARRRAMMEDEGSTTSESGDDEDDADPAVSRARRRAMLEDDGSTTSDSDDDGDGSVQNGDVQATGRSNNQVDSEDSDSDESDSDDSDSSSSQHAEEPAMEVSLEELQELKRDGKSYKLSADQKKSVAKLRNKKFARPNKNAPMVASSKIKVSRHREVVPVKKVVRRDPRFSDVSGEFNDGYFRQSYKFLENYQESEIAEIRKQLKKSKKMSEAQRRSMQAALTKLQQMRSSWRRRQTQDKVTSEIRKANRAKIRQGQTPFYPSKRAVKETVAAREYKYLTENKGKLVDTIMKKKRRKLNKHSHGQKPGRY